MYKAKCAPYNICDNYTCAIVLLGFETGEFGGKNVCQWGKRLQKKKIDFLENNFLTWQLFFRPSWQRGNKLNFNFGL